MSGSTTGPGSERSRSRSPTSPAAGTPTLAQFLWAVLIGVLAAVLGAGITRGALFFQPIIERRMVLLMPVVGIFIGVITLSSSSATDQTAADVLFSGQDQLGPLITDASSWTVGALLLFVVCKSLAYAAALTSFRGGPVFPGMFIGAALGALLSHLPGLPLISGVAMGIGAMTVAMLGLPLVSVLLVVLFLQADGLQLTPVVIVAVVVSYVVSARLKPEPPSAPSQMPDQARAAL